MKQIRRGVFETNSSSTHSLTMCTKQEFEDWKAGKIFYDSYREKFVEKVTLTPQQKELAKQNYEEVLASNIFYKSWEQLTAEEQETWYQRYYINEVAKCEDDLVTYKDYFADWELTPFTQSYRTPYGEEIVAFGKYGYT